MIQIFAIDEQDRREEITDLYWFEENYIHNFENDGTYNRYKFEIFIDGVLVYYTSTPKPSAPKPGIL